MTLTINGKVCKGMPGQTILSLAQQNDIYIPTLCHAEKLTPSGACSLCVVEVQGVPRLLRACATPIADGMVINTASEKVCGARKTLLELSLSTHTGDCKAPCQLACPAESDCQGYIALIAAGKTRDAVRVMKEAHPFPASIARICPRPCEGKCRRALVDEAVNIAGLKRFAADMHLDYMPEIRQGTGKKIAIVGGGPAGLTAAYFLRRAGYVPEVFESMPKMGGLFRYGIPEYRLPKAILDAELDVLQKMGIAFKNNMTLGQDMTLPELQQAYDGVIVAIGAGASKPIWCDGEDSQGVFGGIDFLRAVAEGNAPQLGQRVIVIGGSNTAMDAARTARRLGAAVFVSYRRTQQEMPAEQVEIEEALAEGVQFLFLTAPKEITRTNDSENGRVTGITLQKMTLGAPDASGRRRPVPMEGADEWVAADSIIGAIGQDVVMSGLNPLENLEVDSSFRTQLPGVYAIGDATGKSWYAIDAIGHGRKVAAVVMGDINLPWEVIPPVIVKDEKTAEDFTDVQKAPRENEAAIHHQSLDFSETHQDLTQAQAVKEAGRCLACGCDAFHDCQLLKLSNMYGAQVEKFSAPYNKKLKYPTDHRNPTIYRDMNKCVHCYLCVRTCDELVGDDVFSAITRGFGCTIDTAFGEAMPERCNTCGKCAQYCPTGALQRTVPRHSPQH